MEVYILDSLYRRTAVVDRFESLIWTERWVDIGDFELLLPSTAINRNLFAEDTPVGLNQSKRVMLVETIEDDTDQEGRTRLKIKGRSLEKILEDRSARPDKSNTTDKATWVLTGTPDAVANTMFNTVCIAGSVDAGDIIPLLQAGSAYPVENLPFPTGEIMWEQDPASLLTAIKDICEIFDLGFRLYRDGDNGHLHFNIYTGNDRTTSQGVLPPVVFSPSLETLQSTKRFRTVEAFKNVAYVMNEQGFEIVYADGVDPATTVGVERRTLTVTPSKLTIEEPDAEGNTVQVEPTATEIKNYLIQQGKNELAKNRPLLAFEGEINQRSPYRYGIHYELGDIVEMRDSDGSGNDMRVTEQIFVHDGEGERSYPTLTLNKFVVAGAWNSWLGKRQWVDFGATEYWNTQP